MCFDQPMIDHTCLHARYVDGLCHCDEISVDSCCCFPCPCRFLPYRPFSSISHAFPLTTRFQLYRSLHEQRIRWNDYDVSVLCFIIVKKKKRKWSLILFQYQFSGSIILNKVTILSCNFSISHVAIPQINK